MKDDSIDCWVYKSSRKEEMYLYLPAENAFDPVPEELLNSFGQPLFILSLELNLARKLARVDAVKVIAALKESGYYLQMPPELKPVLYFGD